MAKPTVPVPDDAFAKPTPEEESMNQEYWDGYDNGKLMKTVIPGPAGTKVYHVYKSLWELYYKPTSVKGYVDNFAVGYNNAICDAGNWLWINDPQSPHNVVS